MLSLRYLLRLLEPFTVRAAVPIGQDRCSRYLEFLDAQTELLPERIYLGSVDWAERLKTVQIHPGSVVLLAGAEKAVSLPAPKDCALLLLSCPLPTLYNLLADETRRVEAWVKRCRDLLEQDEGMRGVVRQAAQWGGGGAVLLDREGRVVCAAGVEEGSFLAGQLFHSGSLPTEVMVQLFTPSSPQNSWGRLEVKSKGTAVYACRRAWEDEVLGILVMEGSEENGLDMQSLCACVMECLRRYLMSRNVSHMDPEARTFQRFLEDVMERRLINRMETRAALSRMPYPVQEFLRVVVISFKNESIRVPYNYFMNRLRDFFPDTNMTVYQKEIVLLYSHKEREFRPSLGGKEKI